MTVVINLIDFGFFEHEWSDFFNSGRSHRFYVLLIVLDTDQNEVLRYP